MEYLYHLTTEEALPKILSDMRIKDFRSAFSEPGVFFGETLETCMALSPSGGGNRFGGAYCNRIYENWKKQSFYSLENGRGESAGLKNPDRGDRRSPYAIQFSVRRSY